jgi:DDE superfamily endonuclease.
MELLNIDEKGIMLGLISKVKVIVSKYEKKVYMTQPGNREWATLIECISIDGCKTRHDIYSKAKSIRKLGLMPSLEFILQFRNWMDG